MRVLVVEDEPEMADAVASGLRRRAMAVDVVYDGTDALERLSYVDYDVVVLDRDLPETHGDDVCRELVRMGTASRILMLTAAHEVADRVDGLALGADDYLPKPFAFAELVARVLTLARRTAPARPAVLARAGLCLDPAGRTVTRGDRAVALTRREFALLKELLLADGEPVSTRDLLARAWDEHYESGTGALRVTMATLRRKLGDPPVIRTVPGAGYLL
ncbi:response regulator transcription factor [Spongiactinospora sp. TRM90649]|uniref:response regulator transcription factor n=1 Tax=Spongiactinospora sp. TRM90649 TaxID=3031114 RepID=UPI0023F85DFA|nr:response regulator transcription factor [Spongiactinospora sp. TRM90649]MDF5755419.1 response regulator transcription factor [Spongiactinospora sp. TRM90649]